MGISMDTYCYQCFLRRHIETARALGSEEKATKFAQEIMKLLLCAPDGISSPWFGPKITDLFHLHYGLPLDRYRQEKLDSNRFVMERLEEIREKIVGAEDPILAGLQFSILGNYLDFSALQGQIDYNDLEKMLETALTMELDCTMVEKFRADLSRGGRLLYITDNAGEIGFDRLFAETIVEQYPQVDITFLVRGENAMNDATLEDAQAVCLPFPAISNGTRIAGTIVEMLSEEAAEALWDADIVLAKGMGNVETMRGTPGNIYYAFLVKCPRFVNLYHKPMMTPMFLDNQTV